MTAIEKIALKRALDSIRSVSLAQANAAIAVGDDVAFRAAVIQGRDNLALLAKWGEASQAASDNIAALNATPFP